MKSSVRDSVLFGTTGFCVLQAYENEDPEMREYRKKLEEQKRLREKFLREKENRRKIAAMEKQYDKEKAEKIEKIADSSATSISG